MADASGAGRRQQLARWCHRANVLPLVGRLRGLFLSDLRILAYHRVLDCSDPAGFDFDLELISASTEAFREQMSAIKRDFVPMRFDQVIDCLDQGERLPPRATLITFDDGYDDNYRVAFPILRDLDMSAMFFVSTGHIDSGAPYAYDWAVHMICRTPDDRLHLPEAGIDWALPGDNAGRREVANRFLRELKGFPAPLQERLIATMEREWAMPRAPHADCRPMSWAEVREMQAGGMEIGSHGVHHRMLAKMPREMMIEEINESKRMLDDHLAAPAQVLSYPVGGFDAYDETVVEAARAAGFRLACSYVPGTSVLSEDTLYALRRLHVERYVDAAWFRGMVEMPELFG
ncbi:polysaccharide deacetylase family protein [Pseudoxanthomonas putridarboris]|uniref:Polysaccharide deacetylase family protein n=1 Tax=Pseudoxanthomonas putridarboris TaxID=752605 RepID=A0ABU9IYD3_9GAMM